MNFTFEKGSLDFLKSINKKDLFMFFVFIVLLAALFREEIKEQLHLQQKDIFAEGIDDQLELEYELNDIVKTYGLDYINVNLFHNGTVSASGYHFKKMSCIAEGKQLNKLPRIHKLQNWVIAPFKEKIAETKRQGWVYIANLKKDKDPYFSQLIPKWGINSVFYVALFDDRKKDSKGRSHFVGYISFAWSKATNFKEKDLVNMEKEKERILEYIIK